VLTNYDGKAMLFENLQESDNSWVRFRLEGTQSNRNAVGARVEIHFGDKIRHDVVVSGSGFLSQNPYMLHFGLGQAEKIDKVIIRWPSGVTQNLDNLESRTTHDIKEPAGG